MIDYDDMSSEDLYCVNCKILRMYEHIGAVQDISEELYNQNMMAEDIYINVDNMYNDIVNLLDEIETLQDRRNSANELRHEQAEKEMREV